MDSKIFEIVDENTKKVVDRISWDNLAKQHPEWKYSGGVSLRSAWRKETARREQNKNTTSVVQINKYQLPRILLLDIETAPLICLTWGVYDQRINPEAVLSDWFTLCWAAKWFCEPTVMSDGLTGKEALDKDDSRISRSIWKLLDEADIVIAHNGNAFDLKRLNTRFIKHNLMPPSPYRSIDTLLVARSVFDMSSNKLDYINGFLNINQKTETGLDLWKDAIFGSDEALLKLKNYCANDVSILEELYVKLRPWIRNHPNVATYFETEDSSCPNCNSTNIENLGFYYTNAGRYTSVRCLDCGAVSRRKTNELSKEKKKSLLVN